MKVKVKYTKDEILVNEVKELLKANGGYCPCRIQKTPDTKCMCKEFRDQIARNEPGECHCGLYEAYSIDN